MSKGFGATEIIIASAIFLGVVTGAAAAWRGYIKLASSSAEKAMASLALEEANEAILSMRDYSWNGYIEPISVDTNTAYQLYWDGNRYRATTTDQLIQGKLRRTIKMYSVKRDPVNFNISAIGNTDTGTRLVSISVASVSASTTPIVSSQSLIHNLYAN